MAMRTEALGNGRFVYTTADHSFGADALLLADFAAPRPGERVCDLGTGCGILPLAWCAALSADAWPARIDALELQPAAAQLAQQAVRDNGLEAYIAVTCGDLRTWRRHYPPGGHDLVCVNPPYFASGSGKASATPARRTARQEGAGCTLTDVAAAAAGLLRHGGRLCLCHRPERLCDLLLILRAQGLEPKRLQTVHTRADAPPWLVLCEARRGGRPGLVWLSPRVTSSS